ncbi:hypothetical protein FPV67DRAFT_1399031, partial [Lyophyllum atratum]
MIGCKLLLRISEALCAAKEKEGPFGGINIIFAGDFAQLPPVGETRLFSHVNTFKVTTKNGQDNVFGKLLWLDIKTVVILRQIMRHTGPENQNFVQLLERLREGCCNEEDYDMLNSRIIKNASPDWTDQRWQNVPVIVSGNDVKDALNIRATEAYARATGRKMHWYYSSD